MGEHTIQQQLEEALRKDQLAMKILEALRRGESVREITIEECSEKDSQLYYRGKIYFPEDI
jgi:predicted transcriptional regulator